MKYRKTILAVLIIIVALKSGCALVLHYEEIHALEYEKSGIEFLELLFDKNYLKAYENHISTKTTYEQFQSDLVPLTEDILEKYGQPKQFTRDTYFMRMFSSDKIFSMTLVAECEKGTASILINQIKIEDKIYIRGLQYAPFIPGDGTNVVEGEGVINVVGEDSL